MTGPMSPASSRPALDRALVSVVLPVYNEGAVLKELHRRVRRSLEAAGVRPEIIFVNDGSSDSSARVLDKLAAKGPEVRVLHFSRNFGHQAAAQAGLAEARGDAVVLMDSDLQDDPETIGRFLAHWQEGYDVVYAIRAERQEMWWKRFLFSSFHRLLSSVASVPIPADAGNFSLIDGRLVRQIVALGECDRYLPGLRSWVGYAQIGVPVRRNLRYDNKPRVSLRGLWRLAKTAIFSFSTAPLSFFYGIGYASLGVFTLLSAGSVFCKMFTSWTTPGWTSQVLVASFFGAVNALGVSILGEYVVRIYDQVRGRPSYIVARRTSHAHLPASDSNDLTPIEGSADKLAGDADGTELKLAQEALALATLARNETGAASDDRRGRRTKRSAGRSSTDDTPQVSQGHKASNRRKR
jgi:polyisoprenyl-phosphate glycosyltransferase